MDAREMAGLKETLAKVRKAVHKIFPRELSPTRLAEKYGADAKKKGAARVQAVADEAAARKTAGDEVLRRQLAQINAAMPGTVSPDAFAPAAQSSVTVKASSERGDYALWIIGGTLAAGAALVLFGGSRR
jgi:hypothetical protein